MPKGKYTTADLAPDQPQSYTAADIADPSPSIPPGAQPGMLQKMVQTAKDNWASNTDPKPSDGTFSTAVHNIAGRTANALVAPFIHPIDTATSALKVGLDNGITGDASQNPLVQRGQEFKQEWGQDKGLALENVAGDALGAGLSAGIGKGVGGVVKPLAEAAAPKLKAAGGVLVDRAAGSLQKDFKRGAEPGRSYLEGGGTPALTMRSLASKAGAVKDVAGQKLGDAYSASQANIPVPKVFDAIAGPVQKLRNLQSGPGGTGVPANIDAYESNMLPTLANAEQRGGFTPRQLFDEVKQPIAKSTRWNDPSLYDLNKVRQDTTGAVGGLLTDAVPETAPLNKVYQGAGNLATRATLRANTGSAPLSAMGRRAIEAGMGGALGAKAGFGHAGILAAGLDSVPGLTTGGYGLYKAGVNLPRLPGLIPPVAAGASAISNKKPANKN